MDNLKSKFFDARKHYLDHPSEIIEVEHSVMSWVLNDILLKIADDINLDFSVRAEKLLPFWIEYPPEQRGRKPTGDAIPLLELGEKTLVSHLLSKLGQFPSIIYPGLPTGGDVRFATDYAYIHLDIKLTGPNDNPDEIVVPPNQVSGDGIRWNNGVLNSTWPVKYVRSRHKEQRINYRFQPKLPPIYILDDKPLLCVTLFLKAVYSVSDFGIQPLSYFELACVPNGLLMFDGPKLADTQGIIISGKDDKSKSEDSRRIRIRLTPLSTIDKWRTTKVFQDGQRWTTVSR